MMMIHCLTFLSLLVIALRGSLSSAFVTPPRQHYGLKSTSLYSDGANPPPFADWGQPSAPPAVVPPAAPPAVAATSWAPPPPAAAVAPPPPPAPPAAAASVSSTSSTTSSDPIATLDASQKQTVDMIAAAISDLAMKPDCCWNGESIAGESSATLDARDAPGPANIAWLAAVKIPNKLSSLTIFNGPLSNVPHLLSRVAVHQDQLEFALDFRPRAYGAYELIKEDGTYPGPEELGRQAFEYSGNRKDYETNFLNAEVQAFLQSTLNSFEGAVVEDTTTASLPQEEFLTRGPHCLHVSMPLSDQNIAAIEQARAQAANYWLTWIQDDAHDHRPGAPVNTQYVYDTKFKINAYGALLPIYTRLLGEVDGTKLTAAESGPLDEAYVGGGS